MDLFQAYLALIDMKNALGEYTFVEKLEVLTLEHTGLGTIPKL